MPNLVELDFRSDSRCKDLFGHLLHDTILALEQLQVFRARPHFDGGAPDYWPELGVFVPPTSWGPREDGACLEWGFRRPCTFALQDFQWRLNNATLRTMSLTFVATMDQSSGLPRWRPVILQPNTVELRRLELWRCHLPYSSLYHILRACDHLEILKIDSCNQEDSVIQAIEDRVKVDDLGLPLGPHLDSLIFDKYVLGTIFSHDLQRALDCCAPTLQELEVVCAPFNFRPHLFFRDYTKLRKLTLRAETVVFDDSLPPKLEDLTLLAFWLEENWGDEYGEVFGNLQTTAHVPELQRLRMLVSGEKAQKTMHHMRGKKSCRFPVEGGDYERRTLLRSVEYTANGVVLEIIHDGGVCPYIDPSSCLFPDWAL